jgi:hypothetical protein
MTMHPLKLRGHSTFQTNHISTGTLNEMFALLRMELTLAPRQMIATLEVKIVLFSIQWLGETISYRVEELE